MPRTPAAPTPEMSVALLRFGAVMAVWLLVAAAYRSSFAGMWEQWNQSDHAHGLVVIPIAVFLIWRQRFSLAAVSIQPSAIGFVAVLVFVGLWVLARLMSVQVVEHFAVVALLPATVLAVFGREAAGRLAFPLLFLGFAVPVSDALVPSLMLLTADLSTFLLELFGIPVYREGQYLTLPGGRFVVADVCSGVRYLMAGLIVTSLYAHTFFASLRRKVLFVAGTGVILILANGLRAFIVMAVASATDLRYLGGSDHIIFGWLLFALIVFGLLWLSWRYADKPADDAASRLAADGAARSTPRDALLLAGGLVAGMLVVTFRPWLGERGAVLILVAIVFALLAAAVLLRLFDPAKAPDAGRPERREAAPRAALRYAPAALALFGVLAGPALVAAGDAAARVPPVATGFGAIAGCEGPGAWDEDWRPELLGAADEFAVSYRCGASLLSAFAAAYARPQSGSELVSSQHRPYPERWSRFQRGFRRFETGTGAPAYVLEQVVELPTGNVRTWHWYDVDGHSETAATRVKLRQLGALLGQRPAGGQFVVLAIRETDDAEQARRLLTAAVEARMSLGE